MARAAATSTILPEILIRPANPAAEVSDAIETATGELQDLASAVALMKRDLKKEYPHGHGARAEVATLYAALLNETARVFGDMIGSIARTGDDVLGVLSENERRNSYTTVAEIVRDDWSAVFSGLADDEAEGHTTAEQWQRHIVDTVRAISARRAA